MRGRSLGMVVGACMSVPVSATDTTMEAPIESVALFKNGLAVLTRTLEVPGPGTYTLEDVPTAVHGTIWVESDAIVTTRTHMRAVAVPLDQSAGDDLREELAGRLVTVRLRDAEGSEITGRVRELPPVAESQWSRSYETAQRTYWWYSRAAYGTEPAPSPGAALILDDEISRHYVLPDRIASLTVHDPTDTMVRHRPVLSFNVTAPDTSEIGPFTITLTYLAKGITWAPAYLAKMQPDGRLELHQQATIRNELESIDDAEVSLISGFPSIEFSHVDSLASPAATLAGFFGQLRRRVSNQQNVTSQVMVMSNLASPEQDVEASELLEGERGDLHYHSIGRHSLDLGASMVLTTAGAETQYDRIVLWTIKDTRDAYGRLLNRRWQPPWQDDQSTYDDDMPWNALRFRNPLGFPMTTAPMMILDDKQFAGQRMSYWTNTGDRCEVPVTRALSIVARHVEFEVDGTRRHARRFGRNGNLVNVEGYVELVNHRTEPVNIVVRRKFSGELLDADDSPRSHLLEAGVYAYNQRHELSWSITLEAGEKRTIRYEYEVFVVR